MIGFTAAIPLEILIAAGRQPVDLRQLFLASENPGELIDEAELAGFPVNCDPWLKGFYSCILRHGIREVIVVTNNQPGISELAALLSLHDVRVFPFTYPADRSAESLALEIKKLARHLGAAPADIDQARQQLNRIRGKINRIDRLFREQQRGSSRQVIELLLATCDMQGDPQAFADQVDSRLTELEHQPRRPQQLQLACIGEIPLCSNLYETLEEQGAAIIYCEQGRQAAMPFESDSLVEQYRQFTLPYDIFTRISFCRNDLDHTPTDGILLFSNSAPAQQIGEMLIRQQLRYPLLTLFNQRPGELDAANRMKLEGFLDTLRSGD